MILFREVESLDETQGGQTSRASVEGGIQNEFYPGEFTGEGRP